MQINNKLNHLIFFIITFCINVSIAIDPNEISIINKEFGLTRDKNNAPSSTNSQIDINSLNPSKESSNATPREIAFKQLLERSLPLTPEQIIKLNKEQDKSKKAVATEPNTPPKPVSSTISVNLAPGETPPVIRLAGGFVSSLVFADVTAQAWPIADYSLGNPKDFNIQWDKKTNALFIQSLKTYATANLAVRLTELDTPVMLTLVSGQKFIDYRVDLQILAQGPNALPIVSEDPFAEGSKPELINALDGIPPKDSILIPINQAYGQAWQLKDKDIFLRTKLTLLSPAWSAHVQSIDGTHVYKIKPTPMVLASDEGRTIKIYLKSPNNQTISGISYG